MGDPIGKSVDRRVKTCVCLYPGLFITQSLIKTTTKKMETDCIILCLGGPDRKQPGVNRQMCPFTPSRS